MTSRRSYNYGNDRKKFFRTHKWVVVSLSCSVVVSLNVDLGTELLHFKKTHGHFNFPLEFILFGMHISLP